MLYRCPKDMHNVQSLYLKRTIELRQAQWRLFKAFFRVQKQVILPPKWNVKTKLRLHLLRGLTRQTPTYVVLNS